MFMLMYKFNNQSFGGRMESECHLFMILLLRFNTKITKQSIQEKFLTESEALNLTKKISSSQS